MTLVLATAPVLSFTATPTLAHAQASSSSDAAGKVVDATGASIPGATVHLVNNGTKAERTVTTGDSGEWSIPNIPPANYSVRVEKAGFKASEIKSLDVEIGKTANGFGWLRAAVRQG